MTNNCCHLKVFSLLSVLLLTLPEYSYGTETGLTLTSSYFRMLWGLLVVLGIILILYGLLRKRLSLFHNPGAQSIKILEMKPIMGKKAICLVEVKGKEYLLGIGNEQINHLATIEDDKDSPFAKTLQETVTDNKND